MEKATIYDYARLKRAVCVVNKACNECPLASINSGEMLGCSEILYKIPDKANEIILKWCEEHPIATRQNKFLEMFPNAEICREGYLEIEPCNMDKNLFNIAICAPRDCEKCKKEYWLAEVEENE